MTEELNQHTLEESQQIWKNECMAMCRAERDKLLAETDWIHLPDVTVTEEYKTDMITYRQQLRDFPATFEALFDSWIEDDDETNIYGVTPHNFNFPAKPEEL